MSRRFLRQYECGRMAPAPDGWTLWFRVPGTPYLTLDPPPPAWSAFLGEGIAEADLHVLRRHERTGRPFGDEAFVADLERALGRLLRKRKPGPKGGRGS